MQYYIQSVRLGLLSLFYLIMETAFYKGFDISIMYHLNGKEYYLIGLIAALISFFAFIIGSGQFKPLVSNSLSKSDIKTPEYISYTIIIKW